MGGLKLSTVTGYSTVQITLCCQYSAHRYYVLNPSRLQREVPELGPLNVQSIRDKTKDGVSVEDYFSPTKFPVSPSLLLNISNGITLARPHGFKKAG